MTTMPIDNNFLTPRSLQFMGISVMFKSTVNPEIFARILFSQMALKDIFAVFKIRD